MRGLVLATICLLISGCAGGSGLQPYLLSAAEVPDGCSLLPLDSEEAAFAREAFNWTGNPGRVDNEAFREQGVEPIDNLVAIYDCGGDEIVSIAMRFAPGDAAVFADNETMMCVYEEYSEIEAGVVSDTVVAFIEIDDGIDGAAESAQAWMERVRRMAGVPGPCVEE